MSLAGLAARYGQAECVREWARTHLGAALRVNALLGAVFYLDVPPPYEGPGAYVFPPDADELPETHRDERLRTS